jgi:hypothetical protein
MSGAGLMFRTPLGLAGLASGIVLPHLFRRRHREEH